MPHTQGTWTRDGQYVRTENADGEEITICLIGDVDTVHFVPPGDEPEANARLICAAPDFIDAVTGDEEPALWQIAYAETVLNALASGPLTQARLEAEDPQGWNEAVREALTMCRRLRIAIEKATKGI